MENKAMDCQKLLKAIQTHSNRVFLTQGRHTYAELYDRMKRLHSKLSRYQGKAIAVCAKKSIEAYAAIYAIILSGNIWVPLSPGLPLFRRQQMLEMSRVELVLTDQNDPGFWSDSMPEHLDLKSVALLGETLDFSIERSFAATDMLYVMFTSGSTGVPKGVPMTHGNVMPFIKNALEILPLSANDVFADYHDFGFDLSVFYLFCVPLLGAALAPAMQESDLFFPLTHVQKQGVTVLATVPTLIRQMQAKHPHGVLDSALRVLFCCGEPFRLDLLSYVFKGLRVPHVYNFYGLTETGVENFYHECHVDDPVQFVDQGFAPIGKTLPQNHYKIVNDELWLSGPQVMSGYLGGQGQERFVNDGERIWFKSGDVVRESNGVVFCKGRMDSQVKIGGYRLDLMDVETQIRSCPGVEEAVCVTRAHGDTTCLVAVVQCQADFDSKILRAFLQKRLPAYMIPKSIHKVNPLPVNASGKIDRKAVQDFLREQDA